MNTMENKAQKPVQAIIESNFDRLSVEEQTEFHSLFKKNENSFILDNDLKKKAEKIIYRLTPPTPQEFLDSRNGWITKGYENTLYDYVRNDFCTILDPNKTHTQIVMYGATGIAKSSITRLLMMYTIVYHHCLRYPQLYYGLSPASKLSVYLMSFKATKVRELLLSPIYELLRMSPRFEQTILKRKVGELQYANGLEKIYWSEAADFGHITLDSGLMINTGMEALSFIGADMVQCLVSEINFFIQQAGITHEEIFQIYTDGIDRIKSRGLEGQYLCHVLLDSSANDTENTLEKYIIEELPKKKNIFFTNRSRWQCEQHIATYKEWRETGKTFSVFIGNSTTPPKILDGDAEVARLPKNKVIDVPIDLLETFSKPGALIKSLKDIAGIPSMREEKLIQNPQLIENIWDQHIDNLESSLVVDTSELPARYIWNKIHSKFFIEVSKDFYRLKRAAPEYRYLHLDLAVSAKGDLAGVTMLHKEWSKEFECIFYVADFSFAIAPGKAGINLSAIENFVYDLAYLGNVNFKIVSTDSFQSALLKQNLQRSKIETITLSVDRTINPYSALLTAMHNQVVKVGKNIFLKNNLDSLIMIKLNGRDKIDHTQQQTENDYNGDFNTSRTGCNAKDVSDSFCGAFYSAETDNASVPASVYEWENKKMSSRKEDKDDLVLDAYKKLRHLI